MDNTVSLLDILITLLKYKKPLLLNFLGVAVISFLIAIALPKSYKSSMTFLPPGPSGNSILSFLGSSLNPGIFEGNVLSKRQYIEILKSRDFREQLINRFDLIKVYKYTKCVNPIQMTLKKLDKCFDIKINEEGGLGITDVLSVQVTIYDKDPKRAYNMINFIADILQKITVEINASGNRALSVFLVNQVAQNDILLAQKEKDLSDFKIQNKMYDPSNQLTIVLQTVGELEAEVITNQKMISYLKDVFSSNNEIQNLEMTNQLLQDKIAGIENNQYPSLIPGLRRSTELSFKYIDLLKEVEVFTQVKVILRQQFELAKLKSAKNYTDIQIIEHPRVAEYKSKPKRAFVMLGITGSYMVAIVILLFAYEHFNKIKSNYESKISTVKELIRMK